MITSEMKPQQPPPPTLLPTAAAERDPAEAAAAGASARALDARAAAARERPGLLTCARRRRARGRSPERQQRQTSATTSRCRASRAHLVASASCIVTSLCFVPHCGTELRAGGQLGAAVRALLRTERTAAFGRTSRPRRWRCRTSDTRRLRGAAAAAPAARRSCGWVSGRCGLLGSCGFCAACCT